MGARGGDGAAGSALPAGPARFRCPEDFCARRLGPGAAFRPESLAAPGKRLLLIRAPADFRPERCAGEGGGERGRGAGSESVARLLIAAGPPERLICARPFGASLRIQERGGAPDGPRPLFPVAERPPPRVPAGLKQRFLPFGARLPSSGAPPRKAARQRGKQRPLKAEPGRRARKKEKQRKARLEPEELPNPRSRAWQPEWELRWQAGREPGKGGCKAPGREGPWGAAAAVKEEPGDAPCLGSLPAESPREAPSCKKKKSRERAAEEPGNLLEEGLGPPREDPGRELPGCIKQSPGKGAGGLWGVGTLKEEPGDAPSLGSLAEESLGVTPGDLAGEPPSCKKKRRKKRERAAEGLWGTAAIKEEPGDAPSLGSLAEESLGVTPGDLAGEPPSCKKRKKRERAAEGLWGTAAVKEEPGDSCLGHLPEEHLGPAGELLACKKEKLDKEPLCGQGTEMQQRLESSVLDWAAPLWQEAEGPEEPWQRNGEAPRPKKKGRRREREDQAGLFAAGT
uniref:DNA-directed RNA polymerase I subunit RPA34 n=1 Tax=Laticauda laticaudata TaxID=8630 RepID=A0A8C5RFA6_LATLA